MTILEEIDRYLARASIAPATLGRYAVNDGKLVTRLRAGGDITTRVAERVRQWMRDNPPRKRA